MCAAISLTPESVTISDPCNPPSPDAEWNDFGSCGPECIPDGEDKLQGVEETYHVLEVPEEGCKNGNEPITPAMLGIDVGADPEPEPE